MKALDTSDAADRIRVTMHRLRLNQAQAARYLGVPQGTLCNWLKGTREPNTVVMRLLDVLGAVEVMAPNIHSAFLPTTK